MEPRELYDKCISGVVSTCGAEDRVCYDVEKVLDVLCDDMGMDLDEAWEYMDFNIFGAYVGECTPVFITPWEDATDPSTD